MQKHRKDLSRTKHRKQLIKHQNENKKQPTITSKHYKRINRTISLTNHSRKLSNASFFHPCTNHYTPTEHNRRAQPRRRLSRTSQKRNVRGPHCPRAPSAAKSGKTSSLCGRRHSTGWRFAVELVPLSGSEMHRPVTPHRICIVCVCVLFGLWEALERFGGLVVGMDGGWFWVGVVMVGGGDGFWLLVGFGLEWWWLVVGMVGGCDGFCWWWLVGFGLTLWSMVVLKSPTFSMCFLAQLYWKCHTRKN